MTISNITKDCLASIATNLHQLCAQDVVVLTNWVATIKTDDDELAARLSNAHHALCDLDNENETAEDNVGYAVECIQSVIDYRPARIAA